MEARTALFGGAAPEAIESGIPQVMILGAGYDARALRVQTPGGRFPVVDLPDTLDDKRWRPHALGARLAGLRDPENTGKTPLEIA